MATRVTHAGSESAYELRHHVSQRSFIWNSTLDAFGDQFRFTRRHVLGVPVAGTLAHGADRSHSPAGPGRTALKQEHVARRLSRSGAQRRTPPYSRHRRDSPTARAAEVTLP